MAKVFQVDTGGTLTTSLVSYYKLEDVNDFFASNNLTNNNSVAFNTGKVSNAADMGASNTTKYLNIASDLGITNGNCSISCWVNVTTAPASGTQGTIVAKNDGGTFIMYNLYYQNDAGTLRVSADRLRGGVADDEVKVAHTLTIGTWFHLVLTYDGTNIELWIDGVSKGTAAASGNGSNYIADTFNIGNRLYNGVLATYLSGLVDEVGIWSKKLSNTEVADLYNAGSGQTMEENDRNVNVLDTISIVDFPTIGIINDINVNDAISLSESVSLEFINLISVSDDIALSESVTVQNTELGGISVTDAPSLAEDVTINNAPAGVSVSDEITIAEDIITLTVNIISVSDSISLGEDLDPETNLGNISVNDSLTITESITVLPSDPKQGYVKMRSFQQNYPLPMDDTRQL